MTSTLGSGGPSVPAAKTGGPFQPSSSEGARALLGAIVSRVWDLLGEELGCGFVLFGGNMLGAVPAPVGNGASSNELGRGRD